MIHICIPHTPDRKERLSETLKSIEENVSISHKVVLYENDYIGWPKAVINMIKPIDDIVFVIASDIIIEKNCVEILKRRFDLCFPQKDGVVEPFNELHNGKLVQHPFGHSKTLLKYLHDGYVHCFADNELHERLVAENKYVYAPEAKITHNHYLNRKAPMDKGYEFSLGVKNYEHDRELFSKRKQNGFIS